MATTGRGDCAMGEGRPDWLDRGRVPGLDGLRAAAVAVVVASHLDVATWAGRRGEMGVDAFFVVSGFLITLLLLRERARSGRVDLRAFYARRTLRIFPAYYACLAVVAALGIPTARGVAAAAFFLTGFVPQGPDLAGISHFWSLSVEEAFYWLWPAAFVLVGPPALWAALAASPLIRQACQGRGWFSVGFAAPTRMDGLAAGCLLAYALWRRPQILPVARRHLWPLLLGSAALLVASQLAPSYKFRVMFRRSADAAAMTGVVLGCIAAAGTPLGRLLEWRPVVRVGVLSYSLYLWHPLFVGRGAPLGTGWVAVDLGLATACALTSYYLIETPFNRLKDRIGRRGSAPHLIHDDRRLALVPVEPPLVQRDV